jgi:hypothetical protein
LDTTIVYSRGAAGRHRADAVRQRDSEIGVHVIVGICDRHVARIDAVVVGIRARRGSGHDRVGDVAVDDASLTPVTVTVCGTFQFAS